MIKIKYTIGILFRNNFSEVALILKNRPKWQAGKYNFPGGHVEENEDFNDCVRREFKEECNIISRRSDWSHIGKIFNIIPDINSSENYTLEILTSIYRSDMGELKTMEDQEVEWFKCNELPENIISNLIWLIPFAKNWLLQGNIDRLVFGTFEYRYDKM